MSGKGKITQTGKLGDVMQESIKAAITVVRTRSSSLGIDSEFYQSKDIHIHVPEEQLQRMAQVLVLQWH